MRFGVFALAGLLMLPAAAAAQGGGFTAEPPTNLVPSSRFNITPWLGFRLPYGTGDYYVFTQDQTTPRQFLLEDERGGNVAVGLNAEARVLPALNAVVGVSYSPGDQDRVNIVDEAGQQGGFQIDGPAVTFIKAGVQYRLPDPVPDNRRFHPAAFVTVAPAVVWMDYPDLLGFESDNVNGSSRHFALNLGLDAVTRLNSRGLALNFAVEDYITFIDTDRIRLRDEEIVGGFLGEGVTIDYDYGTANMLLVRAGVSWRF